MNNSTIYLLMQVDAYGNENAISAYSKKKPAEAICSKRNDNPRRAYDYKVKRIILKVTE